MADRILHLVRHGETVGESSIRFHGRNDVALSDLGRAQVGALAERLRTHRYDAVACSPLVRATESAEILLRSHGKPAPDPVHIVGLQEVFFGELEGMTLEEIQAHDPAWNDDWRAGRALGYPGGETFAEFGTRVRAAVDQAFELTAGNLLIVAHKGVIRRALYHLVPGDAAAVDRLPFELATATELQSSGGGWRLGPVVGP